MSTRLMDRERVSELVQDGAQLADVLPRQSYESERIAGAFHVPLTQIDSKSQLLDKSRPVVVYCNDFL